jgi:hypothetical protein
MLQLAEGELRRSLEDGGVRLLSLDISWSGRESAETSARHDGFGRRDGSAAQSAAGAGDDPETTSTETTLELPNGVLVDVLA